MVQQRSRVKDLFSLVGYDDSCLVVIRHVKSIIRAIQPRPTIRSPASCFLYSYQLASSFNMCSPLNQKGKMK